MGERKHERHKPGIVVLNERILLIRELNRKQGLSGEAWDRERLYRLCRVLKCQPEELAERYFVPIGVMNRWIKENRIPPYVSFNFENLEKAFFSTSREQNLEATNKTPNHD